MTYFPLHALLSGFCTSWRRGISRVLKLSNVRRNATVRLIVVFFMWQFLQGWQVWDRVTGGKEGQKVGRQELGHLAKSESRSRTALG